MGTTLRGFVVYNKDAKVWLSSVEPLALTQKAHEALVFETKEGAKFHADMWAMDVKTIKRTNITQAEYEKIEAETVEIWD